MSYKLSDVKWKLPKDVKPWEVVSNRDYAELQAGPMWNPSRELSALIKPVLPTKRDYAQLLRRELRGDIELSDRPAPQGRNLILEIDPGRMWERSKHYMLAFIDHEDIITGNTDAVRGACFDACRLLAKRITADAERVIETMCPRGASVDYDVAVPRRPWPCTKILFFGAEPIRMMGGYGEPNDFAAFDDYTDRVMLRMASYYFAVPA